MALTDTFAKNIKHSGKPAGDKHADGQGLYLHVTAAGKYWRMAYRYEGKQKTLSFGVYPATTLAMARDKRKAARELLAQDIDPGVIRKADKLASKTAAANTFEAVARELHTVKRDGWSETHSQKWLRGLELHLFPGIGGMPLESITPAILLAQLRAVEAKGFIDRAHDLQQSAGQVFRYGVQTGRCERSPVPDLVGALKTTIVTHRAAVLDPMKAGELLRAIAGYEGQPTTRAALQLSAQLFQRPGNIRAMEWGWIDFEKALLTIPAASMKRTVAGKVNGRAHLVPLARQAVAILQELHPLTGAGVYVFPSLRSNQRPMSNVTLNAALRRLGFSKDEATAHGFRAMARTLIAENLPGIHQDVIEAQLAHGKSGPLGMAYDRAEYMAQRVAMMQTWSDYLDQLRDGAEVIPLHRKTG